MLLPEPFLNWMQVTVTGEAFYGFDSSAIGLDGKHGARFHRLPVEHYGAGAAKRCLATNVRPRQAKHIPQIMYE